VRQTQLGGPAIRHDESRVSSVSVIGRLRASSSYRAKRIAKRTFLGDGSLESMWIRQVMNSEMYRILKELEPNEAAAVEVGGGLWSALSWASYQRLPRPAFDLVEPPSDFARWGSFDVVICDQFLHRMADPLKAFRTLVELARPGGTVLVSMPFLVKIDPLPGDYWRVTPEGLALMMEHVGLSNVSVDGWGNRRCIRANFRGWIPRRPWRSLRNEPHFPAVVWGCGTRSAAVEKT
jgi:hypothetical protein